MEENHIETGNYIEKIFPFMGVRFIAVTDNFDSMNISGQNETLGVNLKNLVNEMYAKDIAVKVKIQQAGKMGTGKLYRRSSSLRIQGRMDWR